MAQRPFLRGRTLLHDYTFEGRVKFCRRFIPSSMVDICVFIPCIVILASRLRRNPHPDCRKRANSHHGGVLGDRRYFLWVRRLAVFHMWGLCRFCVQRFRRATFDSAKTGIQRGCKPTHVHAPHTHTHMYVNTRVCSMVYFD